MRKRAAFSSGIVAFLFVTAVFTSLASAQSAYEVWACGDFNIQGYQDQSTIQFYPFNAKIGDLYKLELRDGAAILAVNPGVSGNFFGYLCFRRDGAPITWYYFDSNWNIVNSAELFPSCSWRENP